MGETIDAGALGTVRKQHVDAWRADGQSQKAFCLAHGLPYHRFVYWRKKLEGGVRRPDRARVRAGFTAPTLERWDEPGNQWAVG